MEGIISKRRKYQTVKDRCREREKEIMRKGEIVKEKKGNCNGEKKHKIRLIVRDE